MKKHLSLILAAIMLLATLSGCDIAKQAFHDYMNSVTSGKTVRTTVTEEEFLAAMASNNFSASAANYDGSNTVFLKTNGSVIYQYECRHNQDGSISEIDFYFATIDNVRYRFLKETDGYVAYKYDGFEVPKLGDIFGIVSFSEYVYVEDTKTYMYVTGDCALTLYFENGTIKSARYTDSASMTYDLFDFGTTVVELPEFTYAPTDSQ